MSKVNPQLIFNPSEFFIKTPMMKKLQDQLHQWIRTGMTGGLILGKYRIGKTRAIEYISEHLVNRNNEKIPVKRMTISQRDVSTVASVFRNLCFALEIPISKSERADDMSNYLIHYFYELAIQNSTKQVVLLVDEMQRLKINQLNAFAELYDILAKLKVNLCIFFIGNLNSSIPLVETVMQEEYELIRGRFFTHSFSYQGLNSKIDVNYCLKEFDKSYTEHFLPEDYKKGWRLNSISSTVWSVFEKEYKRKFKINSWGMQYFIATIRILLIDFLPRYDLNDPKLIEEMVVQSIEASGLIPNLVIAA